VFEYVHAIEGRLRIKVPEVKRSPEVARRVEGQFRAIDGVLEVGANPVTGNVLFHYDPDRIEPYAIMGALVTLGYMKETALDHPAAGAGELPERLADRAGATLAQTLARVVLRFLGLLVPQHDPIVQLAVAAVELILKGLFRQVAIGLI
jgi:ATP-binding cassette subfamily B protein